MPKLTPLASLAVKALEDLKGLDIQVLDVAPHTSITDWWIICTGTSNRHVKSLAENVVLKAKDSGVRPRGTEGMERSEWVLVDLGSVVVHVLQVQARAHYQLEKLMPESAVAPKKVPGAAPRKSADKPRKSAAAPAKKGKKAPPRRAAAPKAAAKRARKPPGKPKKG